MKQNDFARILYIIDRGSMGLEAVGWLIRNNGHREILTAPMDQAPSEAGCFTAYRFCRQLACILRVPMIEQIGTTGNRQPSNLAPSETMRCWGAIRATLIEDSLRGASSQSANPNPKSKMKGTP